MATGQNIPLSACVYHAPFGPLTIEADDRHIHFIHFGDHGSYEQTPLIQEAIKQLSAYFSGKLKSFALPLSYSGTAFQNRVWAALETIPYGQLISYRDLAEIVGSPRAFRAVGQANGKNPIAIVVPCHRVIAHDGSLGGYSAGLAIKKDLLALEKVHTT